MCSKCYDYEHKLCIKCSNCISYQGKKNKFTNTQLCDMCEQEDKLLVQQLYEKENDYTYHYSNTCFKTTEIYSKHLEYEEKSLARNDAYYSCKLCKQNHHHELTYIYCRKCEKCYLISVTDHCEHF